MQEVGTEIAMIKREIKKIKFDVDIKHVKSHVKETGTWRQQSLLNLIKECSSEARETREKIKYKENNTNMIYFGCYALSMDVNVIG